jgi:hypothetical protein
MGREIEACERLDEAAYSDHLRDETRQVMVWFRDQCFESPQTPLIGLELEAWLVDENCFPTPRNVDFLKRLNHPLAVPELSRFNFEFNAEPATLSGRVFSGMREQLNGLWSLAETSAQDIGIKPLMVGIPATLREEMLTTEYMTPSHRYELLNSRVFELRSGKPLNVEIDGREALSLVQDHLMLEAACTSLQIHLMLDQATAARSYNAAQIASAPLLAVGANSPFLYGRRLWEETRIPAFESAINLPGCRDRKGRRISRVTFGTKHLKSSLLELFLENLEAYPALLPLVSDQHEDPLTHLKLQNGTIWRWNRPIIDQNKSGTPHIRVENRVLPAGPTIVDMVANTAFFIGLTLYLRDVPDLEKQIPFETARSNFYAAAQRGLGANLTWLDGQTIDAQRLIHSDLAGHATNALIDAGVDRHDAEYYVGIVRARALNGQTGAAWQRAHANCHGRVFQTMMAAYLKNQQQGQPVHTWRV